MFGSDAEMRVYAVLLCLGLSVYFSFRYPSAVAILGFTVVGLGSVPILGSVHYVNLVLATQTALVVVLAARIFSKGTAPQLFRQFRSCRNMYTFCLVLIWLEILVASALDLNVYRMTALKFSIFTQWLPFLLLALALPVQGPDSWCRGLFLGMAGYAIAFVAPLLPVMYLDARLQNAVVGAARLTTYLLDPINGSRMFFFGAVGFFALGVSWKGRLYLKGLLFGAAGVFFFFMMLNGTRQFLLSLILAGFFYLWRVMARKRGELVLACLLVFSLVYSVRHFLTAAAGVGRFDSGVLEEEAAGGRGAIWTEAFLTGMNNPMTGVGFRNFGDETPGIFEETGEIGMTKDCAHGFFQTIAAEHGLFTAVLTAAGIVLLMRKMLAGLGQAGPSEFAFFFIVTALAAADNFSCSVYNAFGYHLVVFLPMALQPPEKPAKVPSPAPAASEEPGVAWRARMAACDRG